MGNGGQDRHAFRQQVLLNVENSRPVYRQYLDNAISNCPAIHARFSFSLIRQCSNSGQRRNAAAADTAASGPNPTQIPGLGGKAIELSVIKPQGDDPLNEVPVAGFEEGNVGSEPEGALVGNGRVR
uniref:Gamma-tubulin complex component n=1 Tax=Rhizophora mucronata TaxID=61149 RepID=A0A2P2LNP7_RHIMU